jgi:hypothetical protein
MLRIQGASAAKSGAQAGVCRRGGEKATLRRRGAGELARWEIDLGWSLPPDLGTRCHYCPRFPSFVTRSEVELIRPLLCIAPARPQG